MKIFPKPQNLNGIKLIAELANGGIVVDVIRDFGDNTIGFVTDNESVAKTIVAAHDGTTITPELTVSEKLAQVGLTLDDLRNALNL